MRTSAGLFDLPTSPTFDPEAEVLALSAQTARLIAVTHALVSTRRYVDLDGLQSQVGLLCAKALDLPPSRTGFLKLELQQLVGSIDALLTSLRENAA